MRILTRMLTALSAAILLAATAPGLRADDAATASKPATKPIVMPDLNPALNDLYGGQRRSFDLILKDDAVFTDAAKRAEALKKASPILDKIYAAADQIKVVPEFYRFVGPAKTRVETTRVALQDEPFVAKLRTQAAGSGDTALHAKAILARGAYIAAGKDPAALAKVVEEFARLISEHPDSYEIASVTAMSYFDKNTPAGLKDKIEAALKPQKATSTRQLLTLLGDEHTLNALVDQPLAIKSFTLDGKPFSTGSLKGKVVLVDFWATWCGPCVAEFPRLARIYEKYHAQGLEIVSVSFDKDVPAITKFLQTHKDITWIQVFDPKKTGFDGGKEFGLPGIPVLFLIDKKGVVRTVNARYEMETMIPKLLAE